MRRLLVALGVMASALSACGSSHGADDGKVSVVASFYPVGYAAQRVGGNLVAVRNLTPAGVEPHDLELTSDDVDHIESADLVVYVGSGFQPAVANAAKRRKSGTVDVAANLIQNGDPHFWLDPLLMTEAVMRVRAGLVQADPSHARAYAVNTRRYLDQLTELDADTRTALAHCIRTEIVTTHAAFSYLARRYGLTQHAITGLAPDSEPAPEKLAELSDLIRRDGVTTVFYEELVPQNLARTLAREAHVNTAVLSPLEGLSKKEQAAGATYLTVMHRNVDALRTALGCA